MSNAAGGGSEFLFGTRALLFEVGRAGELRQECGGESAVGQLHAAQFLHRVAQSPPRVGIGQCVVDDCDTPGELISEHLVRGASGGVGSVAVQLGREVGACVTALASAKNLDFVRDSGAAEAFDYAITRPADLGRFDVFHDIVGTDLAAYRRLQTKNGRMVSIIFDADHPAAFLGYIAASSVFGSRRIRFFRDDAGQELLTDLARLVDSGAIHPIVSSVHPLVDIAEAHRVLEAGGTRPARSS